MIRGPFARWLTCLLPCCALAVLTLTARPAGAAPDPRDYQIRGLYVGMSETDMRRVAGDLERVSRTENADIDASDRLELWQLKKDRDVIVGLDKEKRTVAVIIGAELSREDRTLVRAGDYQFRAQLTLMPMQHDDSWVYRSDRFNLAFVFVLEASKTAPVIHRIVLFDPSVPVKGGWLGGVDPRPGPRNDGPSFR